MRWVRRSRSYLPLGLAGLASVAASLALVASPQRGHAQEPPTANEIAESLKGLVEPGWVEQRIATECEAVASAGPDELEEMETWIARVHAAAIESIKDVAKEYYSGEMIQIPPEVVEAAALVKAVRLIRDGVADCIKRRRAALEGGAERFLSGSWKAECISSPGLHPDTLGRLELRFQAEGLGKGVFYPTESRIGLDIVGTRRNDGSVQMRLANPEQLDQFDLGGTVRDGETAELNGSGWITWGIEITGCNIGPDPNVCEHRATCRATWMSN